MLFAILYSCLISVLFFVPSPQLPEIEVSGTDKIVHGLIYFVLINLWMFYFYTKNGFSLKLKCILVLIILLLLYGIIVEILQHLLTVSRQADIYDIAANLIGSLLGIFFFQNIKKYLNT
ncbi:VanZ-like domain-containing protein [Aequorivita lipolytica]